MYLSSRLQHRLSQELWLSILQKKICREGIQNRLQQDNLSGKLYTPSTCVRLEHIASPILTSTINVIGILAYRVSLFAKTFLLLFFQFCIYIFFFFLFFLSLKFLFHDFERLQLKYLFFGIPAPFLLSLEFYFGISVLLLISGIPPFLVGFSPPRISPLVWSFPLRPGVDSEYGNRSESPRKRKLQE